jgi:hypothetical protein
MPKKKPYVEKTDELIKQFKAFKQGGGNIYHGDVDYNQLTLGQKERLRIAGADKALLLRFFNKVPDKFLDASKYEIPKEPTASHSVSTKQVRFASNVSLSKPQSTKPPAQSAVPKSVLKKPLDSSFQPVIESSGQDSSSLDIPSQAVLTSGLHSGEVSHQSFSPDSPVGNTQTAASSTPSKQWIATFLQGCAAAALCYAIYQYGDVVQQGATTLCTQALPYFTTAIESAYAPTPVPPEVLDGTMSKAVTVSSAALPMSLPSNALVLAQTPDYVNLAACPALLQCGLKDGPLIDLNNLWQTLSFYIPSFTPGDSLQNVLSQLSNVVSQNQLGADVQEALIQFDDMALVPVGEGTQPPASLVQQIKTFFVDNGYELALATSIGLAVAGIVYARAHRPKQSNKDPSASTLSSATVDVSDTQPGAEETISQSTATNAETATASWISPKNLSLAAIVIGAGVALSYAYPSVVEPTAAFLSGAASSGKDMLVAGKDMLSENAQYYGKDWQSWLTGLVGVGTTYALPTLGKQTMAAVKGLTSGRHGIDNSELPQTQSAAKGLTSERHGIDNSELPQTQSAAAVDGSVQLQAVAPIHANTPNLSTASLDPDTFRLQHAGQLNGQRHSREVVYRRDGKEHMPDSAQHEVLQDDIGAGFVRDQVKVDWRHALDASNQSVQSVEFNAGYHGVKEAMAAMPGMKIRATGSQSQAFFHGMCQAVRDQYPHARLSHHIAGYGELAKKFGDPPTNRPNRLKPLQAEVLQKTQGAEVDLGISSNDAAQPSDAENDPDVDPDNHPDNPTPGHGGKQNTNS